MCYSKISLTSLPIAYLTFSQLDLTVRLNGIADYSPLERLLSLPHNLCFNQRYDLHTLLFFWFTQSLCIVTFAKKLNFSNISPKSYSIYQCSMKFDQNVFTWLNNTMLKVVKIKTLMGATPQKVSQAIQTKRRIQPQSYPSKTMSQLVLMSFIFYLYNDFYLVCLYLSYQVSLLGESTLSKRNTKTFIILASLKTPLFSFGCLNRTRTCIFRINSPTHYQLCYQAIWQPVLELNQ